jgi:hypothetical protein
MQKKCCKPWNSAKAKLHAENAVTGIEWYNRLYGCIFGVMRMSDIK